MNKIEKYTNAILITTSMIAMGFIIISIIANVILRSAFNRPIIWIIEVDGILVVWLTFMVLGVNFSLQRHFKIEFGTNIFSESTTKVFTFIKDLIVLITVVCMIWFTMLAIKNNFLITTSVIEVKVWIAYYLPALIGSAHALFVLIAKYASARSSTGETV